MVQKLRKEILQPPNSKRYLSAMELHPWCVKIDRLSTNIPTISKSGLKAADENFALAEIMCGRVIAALCHSF